MPDTDTATVEEPAAESGEIHAIRLSKSAELPVRSDMWQPPPLKKSTLLSAVVGILAVLGTLTGGSSYLGNAQSQSETRALVQDAVDEAIERMENRQDKRSNRIERKLADAMAVQSERLDKIDGQQQEMKLDIRDIQRDIRDMSK